METALNILLLKTGFFKDRIIGQKIDLGSRRPCLSYYRQQAVLKFNSGYTPAVSVVKDLAFAPDLYIKIC